MGESGGTVLCMEGSRPHLLDKPFDNPLCGMGVGIDKGEAGSGTGSELLEYASSCWHLG